CDDFSKIMHDEFEMSMMGELNFFLGLQIKQFDDGIFFNQSKYVKEMLKKFGLEDSKPIKTPMSSETKLTRDEDGEPINDTKYRGMIGSLLYLMASHPDIIFSVCLCARFQEAPKTTHLEAVKRIFRYIKGSGYQQKDRKPSQNDKTEHGMEKTVQNQGQSPKMSKSESILKNTIGCNLNPSDGPGKPNSITMKTVKTKWALNQFQQPICVQLTKTVKTLKAQS
ncbi:retrovirus-related pol polyprotein from transposon TNT 1-94, partial [Tanacetum coccineum]